MRVFFVIAPRFQGFLRIMEVFSQNLRVSSQNLRVFPQNLRVSSEKLTVRKEDIIKGVVIKGIVSTPKAGHKKKDRSSKTVSTTSLNPFEKRKAPNPPPPPPPSDSVPKTKAAKKRGMSVI